MRLGPVLLATGVALLLLVPAAVARPALPPTVARAPVPSGPAPEKAAPTSSLASCATPASSGTWGTGGPTGFFSSVKVQFYVPNDPALSGSNFNVTPCSNTIPTYLNGFWMNISTSVQIAEANLTIWGTTWQLPYQQFAQPIPGFSPGGVYDPTNGPRSIDMYVNPPLYQSASFFFNDYKDFWPGSTVYFNLTVTALNASPAKLYSSNDPHHTAALPAGTNDLANWNFTVASPWTSNNFSQDIAVTTTPPTTEGAVYAPNPQQPLQITLTAINVGTGTTLSIPMATINISVSSPTKGNTTYTVAAGPANHSVENIIDIQTGRVRTVGPFDPGSNISIVIAAWVPWEGGVIDRLYSPVYNFTWSSHGGWWQPHQHLENNLVLTTDPAGLSSVAVPLPTMTPVNVTITEPIPNVTIGSAAVAFQYHDRYGENSGEIPMSRVTDRISYALIPGLPAGGNLTFSVLAKDIFGNTLASYNYSYYETGPLEVPPAAGTGFLFFEAVDLSTGLLYPNLPFSLANSTWTEHANGTVLGYAGVRPPAGLGFLPLSYGNYTLTVYANGASQNALVHVSSVSGTPVVFYFTSQPLTSISSTSVAAFSLGATVGILAAALAVIPLRAWFVERRRKAEREQKRISL